MNALGTGKCWQNVVLIRSSSDWLCTRISFLHKLVGGVLPSPCHVHHLDAPGVHGQMVSEIRNNVVIRVVLRDHQKMRQVSVRLSEHLPFI